MVDDRCRDLVRAAGLRGGARVRTPFVPYRTETPARGNKAVCPPRVLLMKWPSKGRGRASRPGGEFQGPPTPRHSCLLTWHLPCARPPCATPDPPGIPRGGGTLARQCSRRRLTRGSEAGRGRSPGPGGPSPASAAALTKCHDVPRAPPAPWSSFSGPGGSRPRLGSVPTPPLPPRPPILSGRLPLPHQAPPLVATCHLQSGWLTVV